ncbi:competence protein CoiA family protein [Flavobacterium johnsoniae]|uniref:Competence protein CoiA-like N-terminal domain-containing protein n=1 Tax=Flavobacterium johnsoniae (strain ATCC 17061 / DSM 2064 / JCM 8514 / BCRC 14874 / CCUG 350202 / NBRC 14942 / NCIMB 11054 / UW101) TaxID=376686 RepID=A5FDW2_FLAJ1|nr:hypothetical protein [Flavobacterium johnsoniae]ABQ06611.1 hypothetical protein Fjoh_3597 [Flavobacterium johnsoniae UW101]OXE99848.1 hypothetical protein B0A63_11135 [Flavobacterium johnsoniae UW101]WQG82363.1 hypothetical protein SR927_04430 [Flavobacterium johnsoniae UW101]SHK81247.1 hypothetical protein SAMN05444146_2353 [Flavobacterium johnsoniae]
MNEILYTIAKDPEGNLFTALSAQKGTQYYCVNCNNILVLKKSGKTGPRRKRPHFAHKSLMPNCQPETALHFGFKTLAAERLNLYLEAGTPFSFNWRCDYCGEKHTGNYTKKLKSVRLEYDLKHCKPDIALLDENDAVFAAIEIVVTNKPSERVLNYYLENKIILIQINLKSDDDIYLVKEKLTEPDLVKFCLNPKCNVCGNFQKKIVMSIIDGKCWNCYSPMKAAVMKDGADKFLFGPEKFSSSEITYAREKGAAISEYQSKITGEQYQANFCPKCGTFIRRFSKLKNYLSYANEGALPMQDFQITYNCSYCCEKKISDDDDWTQILKWQY